MTRTISLIIGIAVTALVVAVPTGFGAYGLGDSPGTRATQLDAVKFFYANELATLVQQPVQLDRRTDAFDRTAPTSPSSTYRDAADRVIQPTPSNPDYVDANQRGAGPTAPIVVSATSSGWNVEWPQVGIGLGIGIALAFGLVLTLRATMQRPLAH